jgi:hypothetical protein
MTQARPVGFDPQRRAARPDLRGSIETLARHLESEERRLEIRSRARRDLDQRNFRLAVEPIACNLLVTAMIAPDAKLSVPRGHAAMWSPGRYHTPVYGQHFLDILDLLAKLKLIEEITRGYRYSQIASQPTTVCATSTLSRFLPLGMTDWNAFRREEKAEVIVLKPKKDDAGRAHPIDYEDTRDTKRWRREVQAINAWLIGRRRGRETPTCRGDIMESVMDSPMVPRHADHCAVLHRLHHEGMAQPSTYGVPDCFLVALDGAPWSRTGAALSFSVLYDGALGGERHGSSCIAADMMIPCTSPPP